MKDVLDEGLIITLLVFQPKKENITAGYFPSSPQMVGNCPGACKGTCRANCANSCTYSCKGTAQQRGKGYPVKR